MRYNKKKVNLNTIKCTSCFKSVSIPSRMAIYHFLTVAKEASVGEIVNHIGLTQPTVSYHLKEMKRSGLLTSLREGKEIRYSISPICPHHNQACVLSSLKFPEVVYAKH